MNKYYINSHSTKLTVDHTAQCNLTDFGTQYSLENT